MIDLSAQIDELVRERAMRRRLYPKWVEAGKITQHQSDTAVAALDAAIATLVHCRASGVIHEATYGPDDVPVEISLRVAGAVHQYVRKA